MPSYTVTDKQGNTIAEGDRITDFRGTMWTFGGVTRGPQPGKSAKVTVHDSDTRREFYAEAMGLTVVDRGNPVVPMHIRRAAEVIMSRADAIATGRNTDPASAALIRDNAETLRAWLEQQRDA